MKFKKWLTEHNLRFVKEEDYAELINLYHLAKTALAGRPHTKYDRMVWAAKEFVKKYPYISSTRAYKDLSDNLQGY